MLTCGCVGAQEAVVMPKGRKGERLLVQNDCVHTVRHQLI